MALVINKYSFGNRYLQCSSRLLQTTSRCLNCNSFLLPNERSLSTCSVAKQSNSKETSGSPAGSFYNQEQLQIQDTVKNLIDREINPYTEQWEEKGIFPAHEVFKKLGNAGLLGISKPTEYGGLGLNYKYSLALSEAIGHINRGAVPMAISVQTDMATPALTWRGSEALKQQYLAPAISGDMVTCIGVSEAQAGSDVAGIKTTAKRVGDDLIINGSKMWITNGCQADWMCCLANTSTSSKIHQNKSLIIVPLNAKGVNNSRSIKKIGLCASDTAEIFFDDVRVPYTNIIGEEGKGFIYQMMQFQEERMSISAQTLLPLEAVIQETSKHCHSRKLFGSALINNQSVHYRLAELYTEVQALRALVYRAADLYMGGEDVTMLVSMAKLKAGRLAREVTDSCLQYWGGMGFTDEVFVSRMYRDMRLGSIGGGADEVMLNIIAKTMGNFPTKK